MEWIAICLCGCCAWLALGFVVGAVLGPMLRVRHYNCVDLQRQERVSRTTVQ